MRRGVLPSIPVVGACPERPSLQRLPRELPNHELELLCARQRKSVKGQVFQSIAFLDTLLRKFGQDYTPIVLVFDEQVVQCNGIRKGLQREKGKE